MLASHNQISSFSDLTETLRLQSTAKKRLPFLFLKLDEYTIRGSDGAKPSWNSSPYSHRRGPEDPELRECSFPFATNGLRTNDAGKDAKAAVLSPPKKALPAFGAAQEHGDHASIPRERRSPDRPTTSIPLGTPISRSATISTPIARRIAVGVFRRNSRRK